MCQLHGHGLVRPLNVSVNFRHICEIERTLRIGADLPHAEYNKARLEEHKQGIQEIFNNLLDENLDVMESVTPVAPLGSDGTATIPVAQSGASSPHLRRPWC